jgi:hypothetical protein
MVNIGEAFNHETSNLLSMKSLQIVSYAADALEFEEDAEEL